MNKEKLEFYSHLTITLIGIFLFLFVIFKYLFVPLMPFVIAWGVAFALRPWSVYLSEKLHLSRKLISVILTVLAVILGIGALSLLLGKGLRELWQFLGEFGTNEKISDILTKITNPVGVFLGNNETLKTHIGDAVKEAITALLSSLVSILSSAVSSVPKFVFFILITVISSVYFSIDLENINAFVRSHLPEKIANGLVKMKRRFFSVGIKYLKAYLILMLITFFVMLVGFLFLKVKNSILIAALISILDVLPVIGVGTVLVPWSVFQILFGDIKLGIGLAVLLITNEIIRQFAEPKIIGKHLGIHPVVSLILLYVGYSVFGILGLIFVPIIGGVLCVVFNENNSSEVA